MSKSVDNVAPTDLPASAILDCPFCGHPGRYGEYRHDYGWERKVYCDGCDAVGPERDSKAAAIEAWNRRVMFGVKS